MSESKELELFYVEGVNFCDGLDVKVEYYMLAESFSEVPEKLLKHESVDEIVLIKKLPLIS